MTMNWHWLASLLLAFGVCTSAAALADGNRKGARTGGDEDAPNQVIEVSTTAYKTAEFGRAHNSPEALVAAAMMLRSLASAEGKIVRITEQPADEDGKPITEKALARRSFGEQADDLFEEARNLALDLKLKNFDAYIKSAQDHKVRGVVGGAKALRRVLRPGRTEVFRFHFQNLKPCEIAIHATQPVHFFAEQHHHGVWANSLVMHGALLRLPQGKAGGTSAVVIKVKNPHKKNAVVYEMLVR
jgi:hypothetical protein